MLEINNVNKINYVSKPAFKAENATKPEEKPQENLPKAKHSALDILSIYNSPLVKNLDTKELTPSPITVILPEAYDALGGEKIYTSEGKLHSIVKKDAKNETTYFINQDSNQIDSIEVKDKKSGHIIRRQENSYEENILKEASLSEYDENGNFRKNTLYEDGKPVYVSKRKMENPNKEIYLGHNIGEGYNISVKDYNTKENVNIDLKENKAIEEISSRKYTPKGTVNLDIVFYNGSMITLKKSIEKTLPNFVGTTLKTSDLDPAERFTPENNLQELEGEKTYYSNGAVESNKTQINGKDANIAFEPNGDYTSIEFADKKISDSKFSQIIEEKLDNNITKTTTFYKDGGYSVKVGNDKNYKELEVNDNGNVSYFGEISESDNGKEHHKSMYFNENGFLEEVYEHTCD